MRCGNGSIDIAAREYLVYIGTYTKGESKGIYIFRLDASTGRLKRVGVAEAGENPSYLAVSVVGSRIGERGGRLYSVNEVNEVEGRPEGYVTAFSIEGDGSELRSIGRQSSIGPGPCHISFDRHGRYLFTANYTGGSITVFPIDGDGNISEASGFIQHEGSSVNPERQEGPHPHSCQTDPAGRFILIPDLGLDRVMIYRPDYKADYKGGGLVPGEIPWVDVAPGSGPRHLDFHPSGEYVYLINELSSTVTAFRYNSDTGELKELESLSTLPEGFPGSGCWCDQCSAALFGSSGRTGQSSTCADIHLHPSGRFLYGSNRGHDSIAIFEIEGDTGRLSPIAIQPTFGRTPRSFAIDPSGSVLLAANQESGSIVSFLIDKETGMLTLSGALADIPDPACVKIIPV